ncbi:IclR family transcriptional regulator [Pseudooceanicola aestuarii]|uniref:IclR family transcriptional regulator n=1 Tax=Pseudooceanicola aestuarii TaxID=2697319 RepID=UPI0013D18E60|nr:IclR family transcriptional regulator [Pseudooceanicola aestuarii]
MRVRQADNVLSVLEFFAERRSPASVADLAAHFGWPRSSTFNLVSTLIDRGYLYEPRARGAYYPTARWQAMSAAIAEADPLPEPLIRLLDHLAETLGETVWIAVVGGLDVVMLEVRESPQLIRYAARPGMRLPIHVTGSGQALISLMPAGEQDALLRRIRYDRYNRNTPMDAATVRDQIAQAQARGWFMSASAYSSDLGGVALPFTIAGRNFAVTAAGPEARVLPRMAEIAGILRQQITEHCGDDAIQGV